MGFILLLVFIMAVLWGVMSVLSLFKGVSRVFVRNDQQQSSSFNRNNNQTTYNNQAKPKKVFDREEGKYVGFEEIKD